MKKKKISASARAAGLARWRDPSKSRFARYHALLVRAQKLMRDLIALADRQKETADYASRNGWMKTSQLVAEQGKLAAKYYARAKHLGVDIGRELDL